MNNRPVRGCSSETSHLIDINNNEKKFAFQKSVWSYEYAVETNIKLHVINTTKLIQVTSIFLFQTILNRKRIQQINETASHIITILELQLSEDIRNPQPVPSWAFTERLSQAVNTSNLHSECTKL
jgi:hypothetical protein